MNSSNIKQKVWSSMDTQLASFYIVTYIFILITNLMLVYGFYKTSRPFTIVTKLFIYLSVVDIAAMSVMVTVHIVFFSMLLPKEALVLSVFLLDMLIVCTISFLRFLSIYKPMYRAKTRKVYIALVFEFLISFLVAIIIWIHNKITNKQTFNLIISIAMQLGIILTNVLLNITSLIILRRSTNSKAQQKGDSVLGNQMVIKRKRKALNTLLLITVVQLVCTLPLTLSLFSVETFLNGQFGQFNMFGFCQCLQISSFGFNSIIIVMRTKNLRQFYYKTKFCCFSRRDHFNIQNDIELNDI